MNILYEDNHLIAVEKRASQLTQGDSSKKTSLMDEVKAFIKQRDNKQGNVFLGLLHRLDRPVGGVVLFAKTSKGASRISAQIRNHEWEKEYEAVVEGTPPEHGTVRQWLLKDRNKNRVTAYDRQVKDSQYAELKFKRLSSGSTSRVQIIPITGRSHQIRVAMASLGTPIAGDKKYGANTDYKNGQIALYACALLFRHPITEDPIEVRLPSPFL